MAEEHRCQAPEGHCLCANNCGFFGSPATMNLCSKCYRDYCLKEQQQTAIKSSISAAVAPSSSSSSSMMAPSVAVVDSHPEVRNLVVPEQPLQQLNNNLHHQQQQQQQQHQPQPNRCFMCRKRVGLTGFKCRCGTTFCGVHRYPEKHACTFDFKTVGREEIAKANPLVVAEKLEKI